MSKCKKFVLEVLLPDEQTWRYVDTIQPTSQGECKRLYSMVAEKVGAELAERVRIVPVGCSKEDVEKQRTIERAFACDACGQSTCWLASDNEGNGPFSCCNCSAERQTLPLGSKIPFEPWEPSEHS